MFQFPRSKKKLCCSELEDRGREFASEIAQGRQRQAEDLRVIARATNAIVKKESDRNGESRSKGFQMH
jgi:hypothetical protein